MSDPYQPPGSELGASRRPRLYSIQGMIIATVVGSLAAGVAALYLNYRALNHRRLAGKTALWGVLAYVLLVGIAAALPQSMLIGVVLMTTQAVLIYFVADQLQGDAMRYHRDHGGAFYSNWRAAGVGLVTGIVILFALLLLGTALAVIGAGGASSA